MRLLSTEKVLASLLPEAMSVFQATEQSRFAESLLAEYKHAHGDDFLEHSDLSSAAVENGILAEHDDGRWRSITNERPPSSTPPPNHPSLTPPHTARRLRMKRRNDHMRTLLDAALTELAAAKQATRRAQAETTVHVERVHRKEEEWNGMIGAMTLEVSAVETQLAASESVTQGGLASAAMKTPEGEAQLRLVIDRAESAMAAALEACTTTLARELKVAEDDVRRSSAHLTARVAALNAQIAAERLRHHVETAGLTRRLNSANKLAADGEGASADAQLLSRACLDALGACMGREVSSLEEELLAAVTEHAKQIAMQRSLVLTHQASAERAQRERDQIGEELRAERWARAEEKEALLRQLAAVEAKRAMERAEANEALRQIEEAHRHEMERRTSRAAQRTR